MDMEKWIVLVKSGEIEVYLNILIWFFYVLLKEIYGVCEWVIFIWFFCYYFVFVFMMYDVLI